MNATPTPTNASPLSPAGSEAHDLAAIWWLIFALGAGVTVFVLVLILVALLRRHRSDEPLAVQPSNERQDGRFLTLGGLALPVIVLTVAAVATVTTTRQLREPDSSELRVEIEAQQWFWRVRYPGTAVTTANEVRLPVDRPVDLVLRSRDVIHSLWVPRLAGKVDLIPGQTNHLRFTPERTGSFRGECAEFCGAQHAHMALVVVVMDGPDYARWIRQHDRAPVRPPAGSAAARGRATFARQTCAGCHTVRGVSSGDRGPDLTLLATRSTIAAGTLPNDRAHLRAWIRNPHASKPGAAMPPTPLTLLDERELADLLTYLGTLR